MNKKILLIKVIINISITEENKSKIHQKFKPIGKSKDKNENKEYDLYTRKQFEENKRCW